MVLEVLAFKKYLSWVTSPSSVAFWNVNEHFWIYVAWKLGFLLFDFLKAQYSCTHLLVAGMFEDGLNELSKASQQ